MMLLILGAIVGFVASFASALLGGGSGLITIPAFYYIISSYYKTPYAMHIIITTVCGVSIVLGLIASYKHYQQGHINFLKIKLHIFNMSIGALAGAFVIRFMDTGSIKKMFAAVLLVSAIWLIFQKNKNKHPMTSTKLEVPVAMLSGFLSVVVGVTSFVTMFFMKLGMKIKKAIAATSVCIFIKSMIAVIVLSIGSSTHVPNTIGYINIPLLLSAAPFAAIGSLLAVKYIDIISASILKWLLVFLMLSASVIMMF